MRIIETLRRVMAFGIHERTPLFEVRNIQLVNLLSGTFFIFMFLYHALGFLGPTAPPLNVHAAIGAYQASLLATLFLQCRGHVEVARHTFITTTLFLLFLIAILLGRESMIHYYLLSGFFSCFYIFPRHERFRTLLFSLLFFMAFGIVERWGARPFAGSPADGWYLPAVRNFTVFVGISSVTFLKAAISHHLLLQSEARTEAEQAKVERLLANTLPTRVVSELKTLGRSEPREFEHVTVLFSDIVNFTARSADLEPRLVIAELNSLFTGFDQICERHDCERIKTIGDAYLAVCGLSVPDPDHCGKILRTALEMIRFVEERNRSSTQAWEIRVGVHTGALVGGIVGIHKYLYDVFGDTVNTAQRMEAHGQAMRINASEAVFRLVHENFVFSERPPLEVKGKGELRMFWVQGLRNA